MMFFIGSILFAGLILLRRYCRAVFVAAQVLAGFAWVFVQYNEYFYALVTDLFPLWVLASLAALAVRPRISDKERKKAVETLETNWRFPLR